MKSIVLLLILTTAIVRALYWPWWPSQHPTGFPPYDWPPEPPSPLDGQGDKKVDQVVMIIGGRRCFGPECNYKYLRPDVEHEEDVNIKHPHQREIVLPSVDQEIKFFTKYGMCQLDGFGGSVPHPRLPEPIVGFGAVAMPDGRVIICGGEKIYLSGGRWWRRFNTLCYHWIHGTTQVKEMRYFNKFNFTNPGPMTNGMKLINFGDGNVRIGMIPWPKYVKTNTYDRKTGRLFRGGELIEGYFHRADHGPRIQWRHHKIEASIPLAHGGCWVSQPTGNGSVRLHFIGGRELHEEDGWTKNPADFNKRHRYVDVKINEDNRYLEFSDEVRMSSCGHFKDEYILTEDYSAVDTLEEDRIYSTCHLVEEKNGKHSVLIVAGGESGDFVDRLGYDVAFGSTMKPNIVKLELNPDQNFMAKANCNRSEIRFIQEDLAFGHGLYTPRSRHASALFRTYDVVTKEPKYHLALFGGFNDKFGVLDNIEMIELESGESFIAYRKNEPKKHFAHRLPWPLMDATTLVIPADWMPETCQDIYKERRYEDKLKRKEDAEANSTTMTTPSMTSTTNANASENLNVELVDWSEK